MCFGAVGTRCEGVAVFAPKENSAPAGAVSLMVNVGAIIHDACCAVYRHGQVSVLPCVMLELLMRIAALNHSSPPSPMIGRCVRTGQPRIGKVALLAPGTRSALALVNGRKHFSTRFVRRLQCLYVCSSRDDGLGTMIKLNHAFLHLRGHSWRGAVPKEQKVNSNVTVVNQRPAWVKRDGKFVRTTDHFETTLSVQLKVHAMSRCGVRIVILRFCLSSCVSVTIRPRQGHSLIVLLKIQHVWLVAILTELSQVSLASICSWMFTH